MPQLHMPTPKLDLSQRAWVPQLHVPTPKLDLSQKAWVPQLHVLTLSLAPEVSGEQLALRLGTVELASLGAKGHLPLLSLALFH